MSVGVPQGTVQGPLDFSHSEVGLKKNPKKKIINKRTVNAHLTPIKFKIFKKRTQN